jgi:hypothetical protein
MSRQPINERPMDDQTAARLLRGLERPGEPDHAFAERLYNVIRREAVRRRPTGLYMLAAAALLVTAAVGLAVVGAGRAPLRDEIAIPLGPSPVSTATPAIPATAAPRSPAPASRTPPARPTFGPEVIELAGSVAIAAGEDAVWLTQSLPQGGEAALIRIDPRDYRVVRTVVAPDAAASDVSLLAPVVGPSRVWSAVWTVDGSTSSAWLFSADVTSAEDTAAVQLSRGYDALELDDVGQLWATNRLGTSMLAENGEVLSTVPHPWGSAADDNYYNSVAPAPAFGSLWAHDASIPAVHRLDPTTGEVLATIDLGACDPGGSSHYGYHPALLYPIHDVVGLPDAIVASCSMDGASHAYDGSMTLIDPSSNEVLGVVDVGGNFGKGAVLDGSWYVPVVVQRGGGEFEGHVALIDATELRPAATFATSRGREPIGLAALDGSLWVLVDVNSATDTSSVHRLLRVQPEDEI